MYQHGEMLERKGLLDAARAVYDLVRESEEESVRQMAEDRLRRLAPR